MSYMYSYIDIWQDFLYTNINKRRVENYRQIIMMLEFDSDLET